MEEKVLPPGVERNAPRIRNRQLSGTFQLPTLGTITQETAVDTAHWSVGRFNVGMQKYAFAKHERAAGIRAVGANRVVRVVGIKAAQNDFAGIRFAVAVGVAQEHEIGLLGEIGALGSELEADRQMQMIGENGLLVRFSIPVGVLVDQDFVVGHCVTGTIMRVSWSHGDPEASLVVEGHLKRVCKVGELLFASKKLHFVTLGHSQHLHRLFAREKSIRTILHTGLVICGYRRERVSFRVVDDQVRLFCGSHVVDQRVADGGKLARFLNFVGIILRTERVVTLAVVWTPLSTL